MGKKNKRSMAASTSGASPSKRHKTERCSLPVDKIKYGDMPENHKKTFYIDDDCGGSQSKYISIISWLSTLGTFDGSVFEGISNLNWCKEKGSYPLVEVTVVTPKWTSTKFLIKKSDLYIIAFYANRWFYFTNCGYAIEGFIELVPYSGTYSDKDKACERVGPKAMISAINTLAECTGISGEMLPYVQACEVFYVHLSEAARFYPIESLIGKSLAPSSTIHVAGRTFGDEESKLFYADNGQIVGEEDDIYAMIKSAGSVGVGHDLATPIYVRGLVNNFNTLSKCWYTYALTGKRVHELQSDDILNLRMRSVKSVRCTLAVLCNVNLGKLLKGLKKKCAPREYEEIEREVCRLKEGRKVLH